MRRSTALLVLLVATTASAAPSTAPFDKPGEKKAPPSPRSGDGGLPTPGASPWDKSGVADWTKVPPPAKEPTFKPPVAKRVKLKNGMSLLFLENHALPIVSMVLVAPGTGAAFDPEAKAGLASFTSDMLDEGAGGLSAIQIAEEQDRLGAAIGAGTDVDYAQVSVSTLTKTLDPTLDLLTKIVTQPTFDQKEFDRVKGDRMINLEQRRDRPREVASLMLNGALYGADSPYGHPVTGTRDSFKGLTLGDIQTFYKERWNPAVMTLVVVGDFDPKALRTKLDATLGAWKPAGVKKPGKPVVKPEKLTKRLMLVDRKEAAQSDTRVGLVGIDRKDKRYYQFEVLTTALGGSFTSRLNNRLREQLGITYGARAGMDFRLQPGPFMISTAIVTPQTGTGVSEIVKILDALATTDLPAEELDKAKQNLIREMPSTFETNSSAAGALADLVVFGLPDNWYASYAANIRKVTAKEVKQAAATIIPAKNMVFSIVGDMGKVRPELDKLDLGEAQMHDLYGLPLAK